MHVRRLSRILMLMIGAFLSACGTQTERGSSGPGAQGRTVAPSAKPQAKTQEQPKVQEQVKVQEQAAAAPPEQPVPEFVSEPEPAGMVAVPPADSFAPESADDRVSSPTMFYEEEQGAPAEEGIVAESRYHEEEEGAAAKDDGIIAQSVYGEDESGVAAEEGITGQSMYYEEEEGAAKDEGIIAQSQYHDEEEGAAKDEGIIAESQYYDEEEGAAKDDGIIGQSQYHEEEEGAAKSDDILAHSIYGEDDSGKTPEEGVSEPKTFPEEKLAQAEEPKAAPVTMLPVTITVEADPLFDFDKYAVRPDSRKKLDDLVQQLKSVSYGDVIVVGFADPIGSAMYNQKLSERRAAAVKRYLEGKGVPTDKIKNEGRGETEEYASYQSCGGMRKTKLISCLQPDRRVEVTVTAQKQQ